MEEKLTSVSRWLLALAAIIIPLTVLILSSAAWGQNYVFNTNQWTRYLLFASWILLAISAIVGTANLINTPERQPGEAEAEKAEVATAVDDEEAREEDGGEEVAAAKKPKRPFDLTYAFTLTQACSFVLGLILYVAYMSWMILGLQAYPTQTGI